MKGERTENNTVRVWEGSGAASRSEMGETRIRKGKRPWCLSTLSEMEKKEREGENGERK